MADQVPSRLWVSPLAKLFQWFAWGARSRQTIIMACSKGDEDVQFTTATWHKPGPEIKGNHLEML